MTVGLRFRSYPLDWVDKLASSPALVERGFSQGWELKAASAKRVLGSFRIPDDFNNTLGNITLKVPFWVSVTGGTSQSVDIRLRTKYVAIGETVNKSDDESALDVNVPITNTIGLVHVAVFTLDASLISPDDLITLQLRRLAADDFAGRIAVSTSGLIIIRESQ